MLLMGKLTISTGPFSIAMLVYQRVFGINYNNIPKTISYYFYDILVNSIFYGILGSYDSLTTINHHLPLLIIMYPIESH